MSEDQALAQKFDEARLMLSDGERLFQVQLFLEVALVVLLVLLRRERAVGEVSVW